MSRWTCRPSEASSSGCGPRSGGSRQEIDREEALAGWQASGYYAAYYATAGFLLGTFGAMASLLFNVIGAPIAGKSPLELIRIYLTFPLGEQALELTGAGRSVYAVGDGLILAIGCCLYLGTGMLLGIPVYMALARFAAEGRPAPEAARRERRLAGDLGDQLLRHPVVAPAAVDRRRPRQLDHQPELPPVVGRRGDPPGLRLDHRPALPAGRVHALSQAMRPPPEARDRREESTLNQTLNAIPTLDNELPRHEELVEERLVLWYFLAALGYMFVSMLGGLLMGVPAPAA